MNYPILSLLLLLSLSASAQVESVELFPDHINKSVLHVSSPSMNKAENRLCYKTAVNLNYVIMISDKGADGTWGEPYPAVPQGEVDGFQGCTISPDGNRIYFDKDNDIYTIDFVGVGKWSKPQMVKSPVSNDEMECRPSVSHDNQTLLFLRNIRNDNGEWQLVPFITKRTDKNKWAPSKKIKLDMRENEELYVLHHTGENKVCFFSMGLSQTDWANYYARADASGALSTVTKIDFKGGYVMWVSDDYTRVLIVTATTPSRIASAKFSQAFTDQLLLANKRN